MHDMVKLSFYPSLYRLQVLTMLILFFPGMAIAVVKVGHSNLRPGSKELSKDNETEKNSTY